MVSLATFALLATFAPRDPARRLAALQAPFPMPRGLRTPRSACRFLLDFSRRSLVLFCSNLLGALAESARLPTTFIAGTPRLPTRWSLALLGIRLRLVPRSMAHVLRMQVMASLASALVVTCALGVL